MLTQALGGLAAALWPPEFAHRWWFGSLGPVLVRSALDHYRAEGYRLAQALVDLVAPRHARTDLNQGGLPYVTDLVYLDRPTILPLSVPDSCPRFQWRAYGSEVAETFAQVLQQTYVGSLDMPELAGLRPPETVLAAHRASGRFDPLRWQLGWLTDQPEASAVVLLTDGPEDDVWEVAYLGLSPPARGRGLGRVALARALELARPEVNRLQLAVDVRNKPADRLYRRAGFRPFDRRAAHVAVFRPEAAICSETE